MPKPKVHIDQDGDGDTDVTVDVETPDPNPGDLPAAVRQALVDLVARMEVVVPPGTTRITYSAARETVRSLLEDNA